MKTTNVLTQARYGKLRGDIEKIISTGKQKAQEAARQELIVTYWTVGQRIVKEGLSDRASYGESVLKNLAEDLGINLRTLQNTVLFFKSYKTNPRVRNLTWSHYRELLRISDTTERAWYEELVSTQKLNRDQLTSAIENEIYAESKFSNESGAVVNDSSPLKRPTKPSFVYKAIVVRVIDGDTVILRIDLGFQVWKEQRVRLAKIDTAPLEEKAGEAAYIFVRNQLAKVPFVMVKTNKVDIYGRFIGDVFYSLKTENRDEIFLSGTYLNQEILSKGLAKKY